MIESTAASRGSALRLTMVCSALARLIATTIGSRPICGIAPSAAAAGDLDVEEIGAGHGRAGEDRDLAGIEIGRVVQAVDLVAGKTLEQLLGDHAARAAKPFLGRLEDEDRRALEDQQFSER